MEKQYTSSERVGDCISIPVCDRHERPAPFSCRYYPDEGEACRNLMCELCMMERVDIHQQIGLNSVLCKTSCYLCNYHFEKEASTCCFTGGKLTPYQYTGNVILFVKM